MRPLEPGEVSADAKAIFDTFMAKRGNVPNLFRTLARRPVFMAAAGQLMKSLYDDSGTVPVALKEMLAVRVSLLNSCGYCQSSHTALALAAGATDSMINALEQGSEAQTFSPPEQAALALGEWMTRHPERGLPDHLYDALSQQFDEGQIIELVGVVAAFNFFNRMANALEVEVTR
ncbi:MAG: carboxymuconolactone decarboxylase family protein [Candidatus Sericytochromatia bacterium]|nr:carboxymuconolactone decarboxylase family protein [Candidatus Sericytochromatia bacterium]